MSFEVINPGLLALIQDLSTSGTNTWVLPRAVLWTNMLFVGQIEYLITLKMRRSLK